jgi:cytosine/adenosine deaminase-related metal-dependent hydrolase
METAHMGQGDGNLRFFPFLSSIIYFMSRYPSEALTRAEALKGMTLDPAYASFSEHELGSLEKGKKADFVVLDQDIMRIDMGKVLSTKVDATVIDGEVLYGSLRPSLFDTSFLVVQEVTRLRDHALGFFSV